MSVEAEDEVLQLVLELARSLATRPEDIEVLVEPRLDRTAFCVKAHPADEARLTGRNGATTRALQTIVRACAAKTGRSCDLAIVSATQI